jgi:hypothetical protein
MLKKYVRKVTRNMTYRVDARVVAVGDDRAFAAALLDELRDPTGAAAMGQRGREVSTTTFDPELLVDGIEAIYRSSGHEGATQTA